MRSIGGFFEIETPLHGVNVHHDAVALSTGRACISVLLKELCPKKIYVPYYTCDATLDPFIINNVEFEYYNLDKSMNPTEYPVLKRDEYFFWTNYFGILSQNTKKLIKKYGVKLIIDDTHGFFVGRHAGIWSFTSARKYFGVPDGAYLYAPYEVDVNVDRFKKISVEHSILRKVGRQSEAYAAFVQYEKTLNSEIFRISKVSEEILRGVNFSEVAEIRKRNFTYLHKHLWKKNEFKFQVTSIDIPFCYPYLPEKTIDRKRLFENNIFVPSLWSDTINRDNIGYLWEKTLSKELLPLPIDHRYNEDDMYRMIKVIESIL